MEARQAHETAMIETRQGNRLVEQHVAVEKKHVAKLTAKQQEKMELQKRVERMLKHTDLAIAKKDEEARVRHAKRLLAEEVAAAKAKAKAAEQAVAQKRAAKSASVATAAPQVSVCRSQASSDQACHPSMM